MLLACLEFENDIRFLSFLALAGSQTNDKYHVWI